MRRHNQRDRSTLRSETKRPGVAAIFAMAAGFALAGCSTSDAPAQQAATTVAATTPQPHPGEAVYKASCASCHDNAELTKAPTLESLARLNSGQIVNTLITGRMAPQAASLTSEQVTFVADYLSKAEEVDDSWVSAMMCPSNRRTPKLASAPTVSTFGFDLKNSRRLTYAQAGLDVTDMTNLEVAWVVGFPDAITMRSQAAVAGSTIFLPVGEHKNRLFAFDISSEKPCIQWIYEAERTLRTSAGFGTLPDGRKAVVVGDLGAYVHMIDAKTGKRIWASHMGLFPASVSTATPVIVGDKVFAPSSQYEIMMGSVDSHVCCKTHGGVVALDAMTGKRVWEGHTMEDAKPVRDRGDGQMIWGPSGAPIWNSPSIDLKRNRLYVGTGEATSPPAHKNSDALMAFDLSDGSVKWAHQATANDIFVVGCQPGSKGKNCVSASETVYRDVDFGASTILASTPAGRDLVLAGQKSGTVWAMDPDSGSVVWRTDIGTGGPNGGIHWGIAADDTHVFAPISYAGRSIPGQAVPETIKPGLYALDLNDGSIDWSFHATQDCTDARKKFVPRCNSLFGLSGAPTIIGDHVVTGGLDGRVYMFERKTGKLVWQFDTAQDFTTVNGVKANGASVDNASIIATNGLLIMNSGYGLFGQGAGNVMIAFRPRKN